MNQYFFKITNTNQDKNKLYQAFREFVCNWDNTLINGDPALKAFRSLLNQKLDCLNKEHSRCKEISTRAWKDHAGTLHIEVENSWYATVYDVKQNIH